MEKYVVAKFVSDYLSLSQFYLPSVQWRVLEPSSPGSARA